MITDSTARTAAEPRQIAGKQGFSALATKSPGCQVERMKAGAVIRLIEQDGWELARAKGSHRQFKHPVKPGLVTAAGKPGDDLSRGIFNSILEQAGLK